jgi:hypothetical protein
LSFLFIASCALLASLQAGGGSKNAIDRKDKKRKGLPEVVVKKGTNPHSRQSRLPGGEV